MPYTDQQKAEAVELADQVGPAEASRQTGIPRRTISSWRKPATQADAKKTQAARQAQRAKLNDLLLEKSILLAEAIQPGKGVRENATALGILIDKFRLEQGEATTRSEELTTTELDREIETRIEEWRRQLAE